MGFPTKPSENIDWTDGAGTPGDVREEPSVAKKLAGWEFEEAPSEKHMNWNFWNTDQWVKYLEKVVGPISGTKYKAYIGDTGTNPLATHDTINAAIADAAVTAGSAILVIESDASVDAVQNVTKDDILIEFVPGVTYTKGTAVNALQLSGNRCRVKNGRFVDFSGGSDAAIKLGAATQAHIITENVYKNCTSFVDNNGIFSYMDVANIEEV